MKQSAHRKFFKFIEDHGIVAEREKGQRHYKLTKDGKYLCALSHTGEMNSLRQAVRQLVSLKALPEDAKQRKFV